MSVKTLKYGQVVAYQRLKTIIEKCKSSALKVIAVAYESCLLTRSFVYSDLTGKSLVPLERLGEVLVVYLTIGCCLLVL